MLLIHSIIINEIGGSHGVRDNNIVAGLEHSAKQFVFGKELYPTIFDKAALYIRNIIFFHPFVDGNKRTSMAVGDVLLAENGYKLVVPEGGVEKFALEIIEKKLDVPEISKWLKTNSKKVKK